MRGSAAHFRITGWEHSTMRKAAVLGVAFLSVLATGLSVEASTWTIPGIVNVGGLNNTHFVSDLAVTNPGTIPAVVSLVFLPAGLPSKQVTLGAGQTIVYRNVLDQLWGASLAGAVQVSSDSALVLPARPYNNASAGTFGAAVPVIEDGRFISSREDAQTLWVSQSPSADSGFCTNIAGVFPHATGGSAIVTL